MTSATYDRLIRKISEGDMNSLEELYNEMYSPIFALSLSIVKRADIAAELTQDTFLHIYNAAGRYKRGGNAGAWVLRIARNLSIDFLRKYKREGDGSLLEFVPSGTDEINHLEAEVTLADIMRYLDSSEREILVLKSQGYTHKEIAEITKQPEGTVRWKYSEAIKSLRKELEQTGGILNEQ